MSSHDCIKSGAGRQAIEIPIGFEAFECPLTGHPFYVTMGLANLHRRTGKPILSPDGAEILIGEMGGPPPLTDTEQAIYDLLQKAAMPLTADQISQKVDCETDTAQKILSPKGSLRMHYGVVNRRGSGYLIVQSGLNPV